MQLIDCYQISMFFFRLSAGELKLLRLTKYWLDICVFGLSAQSHAQN